MANYHKVLSVTLLIGFCLSESRNSSQPNLRIHNGEDATLGQFPFVGLILATASYTSEGSPDSQYMCGGSILSSRVILTAAHCVVKDTAIIDTAYAAYIDELYNPRHLVFHSGEVALAETEDSEQRNTIAGVIVHEQYDSTTVANDIALLVTSEDIVFNAGIIAAIDLPEEADKASLYADGAAVTVIGWGTTESGETSDNLQKLAYTVTPASSCTDTYGAALLDGMWCTGSNPETYRADTGDSGGPLFTEKDGKFVQLGLVSWGPEVITAETFDVNTNVLYFKDWITENMGLALSEYVQNLNAGDSTTTVVLSSLRNYLYKTTIIKPTDSNKYTRISISAGTMESYDFIMIYDGDNVLTSKMLAQISGTISTQTFTASTNKGLTVAISTGKAGESDGFMLEYSQVTEAGTPADLTCPSGYTACKDNFYCLNNQLWCDSNLSGDCLDGQDEVQSHCDNIDEDDNNNNNNNNNDNDDKDDDDDDDDDDDNSSQSQNLNLFILVGLLLRMIGN